jgi:inhibitor of cysteine peptidase
LKAILNKEFTLSLDSNPTTGYRWEAEFDIALLTLKRSDFERSNSRSIGASGIERFTFMPIKTGETEIIMNYKRPWENKSAESRSFRIIIVD